MSSVRFSLASFAAVLILWVSAPLHSAQLTGAASPADLVNRYSQALGQKDAKAYSVLVCWDRVAPQDRKSLESGFAEDASNTTSDFRFLTLEQMDQETRKAGGMTPVRKPLKRDGVMFDFNLPVIGYLTYHFRSRDGQSQGNGAVPVGMKGGRYFVTTRAPVS